MPRKEETTTKTGSNLAQKRTSLSDALVAIRIKDLEGLCSVLEVFFEPVTLSSVSKDVFLFKRMALLSPARSG